MNDTHPLLPTRLLAPPTPERSIIRSRLLDTLCENLSDGGRLSVITGPAGYGKSTLMTQCKYAYEADGWCTAWLNIEQSDNDEVEFCRYFAELVQTLGETSPTLDRRQLSLSQRFLSGKNLILQLVHDVCAAGGKYVIFLDDYQAIENSKVQAIVRELVNHLPPNLNLVIGSRLQLPIPLAKFRTSGRLITISPDDLRLDRAEAESFFKEVNKLDVEARTIEDLHQSTGGWAAVMQLAAISLREHQQQGVPAHWIARGDQTVSDFFAEEVLDSLPEATVKFLCFVSVAERICAPLAAQITGSAPLSEQLPRLSDQLQLMQELDGEGNWYRIHPVFRDFLSRQLQIQYGEQESDLHHRACHWYEDRGLIAQAAEHAVKSGDLEHARELLEERGIQLINQGHLSLYSNLVQNLPDSLLSDSLEVLLQLGWSEVLRNNTRQTISILNQISEILSKRKTAKKSGQLEVAELQNAVFLFNDDLGSCVNLVDSLQTPVPDSSRTAASFSISRAYFDLNHYDFATAMAGLLEVTNRRDAKDIALSYGYATCTQSLIFYQRGLLRQAITLLQQKIQWLQEQGSYAPTSIAILEHLLAVYFYQMGRLHDAKALLLNGEEAFRSLATPDHILALVPVRARLLLTSEGPQQAIDFLLEMKILAEEREQPRLQFLVCHERVRLYLQLGHIEQARVALERALDQYLRIQDRQDYSSAQSGEWLGTARCRFALADGDFPAARKEIAPLLEQFLREGRTFRSTELHVLLARIHSEAGKADLAKLEIKRALDLDAENSSTQIFRDEGDSVLSILKQLHEEIVATGSETADRNAARLGLILAQAANFDNADTTAPPQSSRDPAQTARKAMVETLTKKELATLEKMLDGLSNKEISDILCVSVHTVKSHLYSAYGKLGVSRRTQAVRRVKELGLFG